MGKHNDDLVLSYGDAFLRKSDLSSLEPGKWLTDAVITFSFEYFEKEAFKEFIGNDDDSHQRTSHSQSLNVSIPTYNTRSRAINRNRSLSQSLGTFASSPFLPALADCNDMDSNISNRSASNRINFAFVGPSTTQCVKLMPQEAPAILDPLKLFEKTHIFFVVNDLESPSSGGTHWSMLHWDRSAAFNLRRHPVLASIPSRDPDAMDVDDIDSSEAEGESDNGNEVCVELLEHYDSIFGHNRHSAAIVYDILSNYITYHFANSPNEPIHRLEFVERFAPQQANGADCGVYVIALVEALCRQLIDRATGSLSKSRSSSDLRSLVGSSQPQGSITTRSQSKTVPANQNQQQLLGPTGGRLSLSARNSPILQPVPSPYGTRQAARNQQLQALLADAVEPAELSPDFIAAKRVEWTSIIRHLMNLRQN